MTASPRARLPTNQRSGLIALIVLLVSAVLGYVWLRPSPVSAPAAPASARTATFMPSAPATPGRALAAHPIRIVPEPRAELSAESDH